VTGYDDWLAANDRFLADAVAWLRQRLERLGGSPAAIEVAAPAATSPAEHRSFLERRRRPPATVPVSAPDAPGTPAADPETAAWSALMTADHPGDPFPLALLSRSFELSDFERDVLLLAVAMELDTRIPALCARAQHDPAAPYPTFALALTTFDRPSWDVLSLERPLRRWQLVDVVQDATRPLTSAPLRADTRIVNYVKGLNALDDRLRALVRAVPELADGDLSPSQSATVDQLLDVVRREAQNGRSAVVPLLAPDRASVRLVAAGCADRLGLRLLEMDATDLPTGPADRDAFVRLWQRECLLSPVALLLDATDADHAAGLPSLVRAWAESGVGLVFLSAREPRPDLRLIAAGVEVGRPAPAEQRQAWTGALPAGNAEVAGRLAAQFDLDLPTLRRIAASTSAGEDAAALERELWAACLAHTRSALDQLAQRVEPKATWDRLKLPDEQAGLLRQIADQVRHRGTVYDTYHFRDRMNRGLGISVLFAGESGTGKTMAAEVLANDLGLLLYRIDLSSVVSKYIGETEKNLRALFDAAEGGGSILFFDEADALFGKRSEVKDSHDRYANIEVNYLLQRMESFQGLAVLATNLKSSLDTAFLRRLRFIVDFPFPSTRERAAIWRDAFPDGTPVGDLDADHLARLHLTGGSIQNIALNAAFAAAAEPGGTVTMRRVLDAARTELRKLDKPVNEADLRWLEPAREQR
jgi:ATPase family associated with various cellular activities (AAA)